MHPALEDAIAPFACIVSNARSPADWPHWFNYHSTRVSIVPPGWPYLQQQATVLPLKRPRAKEERAASSSATASSEAATLPEPWCVRCPDEKRKERTCPYCGPPHDHGLSACKKYTRWLKAGGSRLPGTRRFAAGKTYKQTQSKN